MNDIPLTGELVVVLKRYDMSPCRAGATQRSRVMGTDFPMPLQEEPTDPSLLISREEFDRVFSPQGPKVPHWAEAIGVTP